MYSVYLNVHIQEYGELLHQIVSAAVLLILLPRRGDLAGTPRACFAVSQKLARPHTHTHTNAHAEILVRHTQTHTHTLLFAIVRPVRKCVLRLERETTLRTR